MAVRAEENEILNFLVFELEVAEDQIVETGFTRGRDAKPEREWTACTSPLLPLRLREIATNAVISPGPLLRFRLCALGLQFFRQAETRIGVTRVLQFACHLAVALETLGLVERPFIPVESKPFHALENCCGEFGLRTVRVRIFNAQQEHAAVMAGE